MNPDLLVQVLFFPPVLSPPGSVFDTKKTPKRHVAARIPTWCSTNCHLNMTPGWKPWRCAIHEGMGRRGWTWYTPGSTNIACWKMGAPDWRCISYIKWGYSIAMLVYQKVRCLREFCQRSACLAEFFTKCHIFFCFVWHQELAWWEAKAKMFYSSFGRVEVLTWYIWESSWMLYNSSYFMGMFAN